MLYVPPQKLLSDRLKFSKLITDPASIKPRNHDRDEGWIPDRNLHICLRFYFSVFPFVLVSIYKIYPNTQDSFWSHLSFSF